MQGCLGLVIFGLQAEEIMRKSFVGLLLLLWVGLVWGQSDPISRLIDDGKYLEAYAAAIKLGTSEGWTQAAKAASFYASYQAK